jgi:hypothetical protein
LLARCFRGVIVAELLDVLPPNKHSLKPSSGMPATRQMRKRAHAARVPKPNARGVEPGG